jgi:hypothetical protein
MIRSGEMKTDDAGVSSGPSGLPDAFSPLIDERDRIDRILERLDNSDVLAERADLGSELVRSTSRYEDALERIAWPASSDPNSVELQELAEERQTLRDGMVVIQKRTQHMDARNVHASDPQGFEDALEEVIRQIRAIRVKEDPLLELVDATLITSDLREHFTSDIARAIRHASERPNPPKTAVGRTLANINVKLDRNAQDVSTPQHPAADTTEAETTPR